jgi:hypothetical protein
LQELGFLAGAAERVAPFTLVLDLAPTEEALLAGVSRTTRQNIRNAGKHDLHLEPLSNPVLSKRMNELLDASFARTGHVADQVDWPAVMRLNQQLPQRSRLTGAYLGNVRTPEALVGFGWCTHHGDRAEYSHGATARVEGFRLPILHPVLWDLILWSKRSGAQWFDFGGVTQRTASSGDALGSISDFKRGFSKQEVQLGEEWVFIPRKGKAWLAGLATAAMTRARAILGGS